MGAYLIGLTIQMANRIGFYLLGLDLSLTASSPINISGLTSNCQLFKFSFFHLDLPLIASFSFFHSLGLTFNCQFFKFSLIWTYSPLPVKLIFIISFYFLLIWTYSLLPVKLIFIIFFTHMDLLSITSQTHSYPLTWTYPRVPVLMLWLRHSCLPDWITPLMLDLLGFKTLWKILDLTQLSSFVRRSS